MSKLHEMKKAQLEIQKDQGEMMMGMMKEILKPLLNLSKKNIPESPEIKEQIDILADGIYILFRNGIAMFGIDSNTLKNLLYEMKQKDLDELYVIVAKAMTKRPIEV